MKDGDLHRVTPAPSFSVDDIKKDIPEGVDYKIVENDDMPDPSKRHKWKLNGDKVEVDETKIDASSEELWTDSEIEIITDKIETLEDSGSKAVSARTYRQALKQYKSDLYMPNITRPKL